MICLVNNKINYKIVKINENGDFDIDELKAKIDKKLASIDSVPINFLILCYFF